MFTELPASNRECFSIEDENAAGILRIAEPKVFKIFVKRSHDRRVVSEQRGVSHAPVRAPIEYVAIVESRGALSAPAFHSKGALAGITPPTPSSETNRLP